MEEKKTLNNLWKVQLSQILAQVVETKRSKNLKPDAAPARIAVVGVGNELNGDDAAGINVARNLWAGREVPAFCTSIEAGTIPENASGPLRRFGPDLVIFVDAADFGAAPGTIRWLEKESISGISASSHTLPLTILGSFLEGELNCQVVYLGIQPEQIEYLTEISNPVKLSVKEIVNEFEIKFWELRENG